jgi:hypothetical protein
VQGILARPRISRNIPRPRPWPMEHLSFRSLGRISGLRQAGQRLLRW